MSIFRFKRFNVVNERSAMKVNTDGVLLGAAMTLARGDCRLLDVGTGTGTIALMAAQRLMESAGGRPSSVLESFLRIDAIDIDALSIEEAAGNFADSPWSDILSAHHASLKNFADTLEGGLAMSVSYDLIFSNPPYFEDSLTAPDERKSAARHTSDGLSYRDILEFASKYLSGNGRVSLVLPADQENGVCRYARMCGLHLYRILRIRTVPRKAPSRMIVEFSRSRTDNPAEEALTIQNEGQYTQEYLSLTKDFYLFA